MTISQLLKQDLKLQLLDKELLLSYVLGVERVDLMINADKEVSHGDELLYKSYLQRLKGGEPVAYIVKGKEFFGLDFYVDERVLIPRPETEKMVEVALSFAPKGSQILDVGTGSGCISVALAKKGEFAITAVDVSTTALEVARLNAESHGVDGEIDFFESDLLEIFKEDKLPNHFEVICANLPYIGEKSFRHVSASAEKFEPYTALFSGEDGLDLYRRLLADLGGSVVTFDVLIGEFCFEQGEAVREMLINAGFDNFEIVKDDAGIERFFVVRGK